MIRDTLDIVFYLLMILLVIIVVIIFAIGYCEYTSQSNEYKLGYYEKMLSDSPFYWHKNVVNISASGDMDTDDWYALQDVMNEWNMIEDPVPDLAYDERYPDIKIAWKPMKNETYAGITWWHVDGEDIISADIIIRTSWDHSREMVIRHELGHAMGLSYHSNHPNSTMYRMANGVENWSEEDLVVINHLYIYHTLP